MRVALPSLAVLIVVSFATLAQPAPQPAGQAQARAKLLDADRQFAAAAKARGLDGWMKLMADDAVRLQRLGGKAVQGKEAVRKVDATLFADPARQLVWEPTEAGAFADGRHGFTTGHDRVLKRGKDGKEEVVGRGSYLTWWRKEAGGAWRVILDTGTQEPPAKQP